MSFDLVAVHQALAAQIADNVTRDVEVYPFDPGPARAYPCIVIDPGEPYVEFHQTFGDNAVCGVELAVNVYISAASDDQREALADFASDGPQASSSLRAAIESDLTVRGTVASCCCYRVHAPRLVEADVLVATFDVEVRQHRGG